MPEIELGSPFGDLSPSLSDSDLRETAYEILVAACRTSNSRPLTYISQADKAAGAAGPSLQSSPSMQRSLTSAAASKVKKALGLKKTSQKKGGGESASQGRAKRPVTVGELVRVQMKVSEQADSRVRRALLRGAAGQLGRRIESIVLPVELLQHCKPSDFPNTRDYETWQKRHLKILECGLLLHPLIPISKSDLSAQRVRKMLNPALDKPFETNSEEMQLLRTNVMSLASRSTDGSVSETCHWADGTPLNLWLYQSLLESCFDINEETSMIEEVDEVLELIKKTWATLGITQILHNLCFAWVLFRRYVETKQIESDLLFASCNLLSEVERDAKGSKDSTYSMILGSTLGEILGWAEKKLVAYHDAFDGQNIESMQSIISLAITSAKILGEDVSQEQRRRKRDADVAHGRVETYIRSSLRAVFSQKKERISQMFKTQRSTIPSLSVLAQDIRELASNEKETFSPILKRWHPLAAGVAVATLHSCYGKELKRFVSSINDLTPDAMQVLIAADKLEKDLVQIAVEDSVDSEDGGKSIIQEMPPYEAESVISDLVTSWIKTRVDRLKEWVDRNLLLEEWSPPSNKQRCALSAVEVLRIADETLDAFFLLPIPMYQTLLPQLVTGLDTCLQQYVIKAKSGCGDRAFYLPAMPALTRCPKASKFHRLARKKDKEGPLQRRNSQVVGTLNRDSTSEMSKLCVRINTLQFLRTQLDSLLKKTITYLKNSDPAHADEVVSGNQVKFDLSANACVEGIQHLCGTISYKVVFHDLSHDLYDGLYIGDMSSSRVEPFLQDLEHYLEIISTTVHDRIRTRAITDIMRASFDGFLFVLLAGGPVRAFTLEDSAVIEEDFRFLTELFWSNGDGLPADLIEKFSSRVSGILTLFKTETEALIERFRIAASDGQGVSGKSKLHLPPTTGHWDPNDANTILRVLCCRNDQVATKFLKKTFNLPKKL